ncbi:MAG: VOC family protein [Acholeplasmataceae bacterium]|jgi:PhnB protein|nr:VOC family protein [Acholeplasmataceae bacterium]
MGLEVYLVFNGHCRQAVTFYADVFNTPLTELMTFGEYQTDDTPLTEQQKKLILHTELIIEGNRVMFSDAMPENPVTVGNNINLTIISKDMEHIKDIFQKLSVGGHVDMELQETFWSKCYGSLTDRYGIQWQFNHSQG